MKIGEARFVGSMFALQIVLLLLIGVLQAALSSVGRYGLANFLESNRQMAEFGGLAILVGLASQRPAIASCIYPLTAILHCLALTVFLGRSAPWVFKGPWWFDRAVVHRMARPMLGVLASGIGYYGMTVQAPRILLSALLGPKAVAAYAVTSMMMRIVRMPIDVIAHSPTVELSLAHGEEDPARARQILLVTIRGCFWLAVCLIPSVVMFGPFLVHVWTRGKVDVPLSLLFFSTISTALFSISLPCQEALMAVGRLGNATLWLALGGVPFFFFLWVMITHFGLPGAGAAIVAIDLGYAGLASYWTLKLFGLRLDVFLRELFVPPIDIVIKECKNICCTFGRRVK